MPTLGIGVAYYPDSLQYADSDSVAENAESSFVADVESGQFPTADNAYEPVE